MTKGEYQRYLHSWRWRIIRAVVLALNCRRCAMCDRLATEVHHRSYDRIGHERLTDLTPVCSECHRQFHNARRNKQSANPRRRRYHRSADVFSVE